MKFSAAAFLKMAQERGATLVVTLLVLTLLSTIVVAFIQTVSMERGASRSIKTRYQAQLAAQAGLQAAASEITSFMQSYPYHGVGYATSGNTHPQIPHLRKQFLRPATRS
jgi:Tfp pilus assembly protein PilX